MSKRNPLSMILAALVSVAVLAGCAGTQPASQAPAGTAPAQTTAPTPKEPEKPYYEGKSITLIVPNSPGKGMDRYARMIVPHLKNHLKAADIVVKNITGAGGVVGINQLWNSKPDGLTIAFTSVPTIVLADLSGGEGVQFKSTQFTYLGRASTEPRVLVTGAKSSIKTMEDVKKLGRDFKNPSQGTDEDFFTIAVLAKSMGFPLKIISGYEGNADTALAVTKGDGDGKISGMFEEVPLVKQGDHHPLLIFASQRVKEWPDVPTALEVTSGDGKVALQTIVNILETHRSFFGPANMDPKATAEMRNALAAALKEPDLLKEAEKQGMPIVFMDGETQQKKVAEVAKDAEKIVPTLKDALKSIK